LAVALYRVNFEFRGTSRSVLKSLDTVPSVGERLSFEHVPLVVTQVDHAPAGSGVVATVHAAVAAAGNGEAAAG
jgi:hypothetical protein